MIVQATITCDHRDVFGSGHSVDYDWSDWGSFSDLYERLDEWKATVTERALQAERDRLAAEQKRLAAEADLPRLPDIGGWVRTARHGEMVVSSWQADPRVGRFTVTLVDPARDRSWNPDAASRLVVDTASSGTRSRNTLTGPSNGESARYSGLPTGAWMCKLCGALVVNQHYHDRWHRTEE